MAITIAFTEQSLTDIEEIAAYIGHDSAFYAALQVQKIFSKTSILVNFPLCGRVVPDLNIRSIRELIEGNYRIIYRIMNKDQIHILTVHHSRKKLKRTELRRISRRKK